MEWHKYSEEKPNPLEICLVKSYYDKQKFGESKPQYMLCEYSFRGEESSEPWTELNGEAETYSSDYSEFWISISEIELEIKNKTEILVEHKPKLTCHKCGRCDEKLIYYEKEDNYSYCVICVIDFIKEHLDHESESVKDTLTLQEALDRYGFKKL